MILCVTTYHYFHYHQQADPFSSASVLPADVSNQSSSVSAPVDWTELMATVRDLVQTSEELSSSACFIPEFLSDFWQDTQPLRVSAHICKASADKRTKASMAVEEGRWLV